MLKVTYVILFAIGMIVVCWLNEVILKQISLFALNGTYFIFIFLFLLFVPLLNEIMLKPVGAAMEKRRAKMQENLDTAKACTQEAQNLLADYQSKLHTSRLEAQAIIQTASNTAQKKEKIN